jgi:predicted amidohydrolase
MKILLCILLTNASAFATEVSSPATRLKLGVVQMAQATTLAANRDRIIRHIGEVAAGGGTVAVFPENVLTGEGDNDPMQIQAGVEAIRQAARKHAIYVLFGGQTSRPPKRPSNWLYVIGPDGRDLLRYDKLFDRPDAPLPGVFSIDGVLCSTYLCADRWLRAVQEIPVQEGARISFELSCNTANEWVAPFGWYWNVPQALRNNVWVVFANTGNSASGVADSEVPRDLRHGHSAVIAPDGGLVAAAHDDAAKIVFAEIEVGKATRTEALVRMEHPVLREFWETGQRLYRGDKVETPELAPVKFSPARITLAASMVRGDPAAMAAKVREAHAKGGDLIAFPAEALADSELPSMQAAARENKISVVFGAAHQDETGLHNSAFVIGPDGAVITRYDQLSATRPFAPGLNAKAMNFRVKGVPAVVTVGRDGLWTELSELAAVAGARIHVHLDHVGTDDTEGRMRRLQVCANLASYSTFTVIVNEAEAMIWDDLNGFEERRGGAEAKLIGDDVEVFSPFSANLVAHISAREEGRPTPANSLVVATRTVSGPNPHYARLIASKNPRMAAWFRFGASLLAPKKELPQAESAQ